MFETTLKFTGSIYKFLKSQNIIFLAKTSVAKMYMLTVCYICYLLATQKTSISLFPS